MATGPSALQGNSKLLVKIFSLKQKTNQILPATKKLHFVTSRRQPYLHYDHKLC